MANKSSLPPSFSTSRRWTIFFSVIFSTIAVLALVAMLNYLSARYYRRFMVSNQTSVNLSAQTLAILKSITNEVKVTVYYDKGDNLYESVAALLDEYRLTNPKISVKTIDYHLDFAESQKIKATYKLGSVDDKNLIIFDCDGRKKIVLGTALGDYTYNPKAEQGEYTKDLKAFKGENEFSSALLTVINPKPVDACYLIGHGEHDLDGERGDDYQMFKAVVESSNVRVNSLSLLGTNEIPADCKLLIIAGPRQTIPKGELEKIKLFLDQGGRLFALFNFYTANRNTGLEAILAKWNIKVGMNVIKDADQASLGALEVTNFNHNQPIGSPLVGSSVAMINPRSISTLDMNPQGPEVPKVDELAWTGKKAIAEPPYNTLMGEPIPLIAAVQKGSAKGVLTERGTTAMVIAGDSVFLSNQAINADNNRDFATFAVDWLLDQNQLLHIGPHAVSEYKLSMTKAQMASVEWLFLGAMPGGILIFGGLVWFRRRR